MWFKSHSVKDSGSVFSSEVNVLYRLSIDEEGVPVVYTECYVEETGQWFVELTSFDNEKSACEFIRMTDSIGAVNWLDRKIDSDGLI